MTTVTEPLTQSTCDYLTTPAGTTAIFTPERLTDEERLIAQTAQGFVNSEVAPRREAIQHQEQVDGMHVLRFLLRKGGELGLLTADLPEAYGGLELGLTVSTMLADVLSADASFSVAIGAQTTIGALPIVFFGSTEQKAK